MRAMLLLVLLLALIALFSLHEPLAPFWKSRLPGVMACLDEGRYRDAWEAATVGDPPGTKSDRWAKSEPLGEAAPVDEPPAEEDDTGESNVPPGKIENPVPE